MSKMVRINGYMGMAIFSVLLVFSILYSCNNSDNEHVKIDIPDQNELAAGFYLLENNCFSCHSPNASMENRVAPPMVAIKKHYINENTTKKEFTESLISFLNNPSEENAKMPGAIKKFNVMPKMNFSDAQISKIASYIYFSELEKPDWFDKHYEEEKQKYSEVTTLLTPIEEGQKIAMKTKGVLGKNLLQALNSKGTEHALAFCSTKAISLTDSMSGTLNAKVKRVSDKNRNPDNEANDDELAYIKATKLAISKGDKPQPQLVTFDDKHIGYYPIMTNQMCMQCHGRAEKEVMPKTLAEIEKLYPDDKALEYGLNELRGIWVVEMTKKN